MTNTTDSTNDPSGLLEQTFRRILEERMKGLPFVNDKLEVEAVGFRKWGGHWVGVLITPWMFNLIAMPGDPAAWRAYREGDTQEWSFPGGSHTFRADRQEELGEYQTCAILPSVTHLPDQEHARRAAEALVRLLFDPPGRNTAASSAATTRHDDSETAHTPGTEEKKMARLLSRRAFLRGAMFRD